MLDTHTPSSQTLRRETYLDKVLGCWTGKNIGGTLGAPFEGKRETNDIEFYTHKLNGEPIPNDDLDLQLVWLAAVEKHGLYNIDERVLGEYWLSHISGMWNEYAVCKSNIRNGLIPPLSGSCNNERWHASNGAWIRSEIWACLFPGSPDEAARYAYFDSCCDHHGDGVYAEVFTAVMESMAFIVGDIRELIRHGLARIPETCRVARAARLARKCHDDHVPFLEAREAIVADSSDLGWFQAPGNLGFLTLALLYGEGDFGKTVCLATNCGDDTDCTAGTAGAILGIIAGRSQLPERWTAPIGDTIKTIAIDAFDLHNVRPYPKTLEELTQRLAALQETNQRENKTLPQFAERDHISADYLAALNDPEPTRRRVWKYSPYELTWDLPFGRFSVDFGKAPNVVPGEAFTVTCALSGIQERECVLSARVAPPADWRVTGPLECVLTGKYFNKAEATLTFTPGDFPDAYFYLPLELRLYGRRNPYMVFLPLQRGRVDHTQETPDQPYYDRSNRERGRR